MRILNQMRSTSWVSVALKFYHPVAEPSSYERKVLSGTRTNLSNHKECHPLVELENNVVALKLRSIATERCFAECFTEDTCHTCSTPSECVTCI